MPVIDEETKKIIKQKFNALNNQIKLTFFKPENECTTCHYAEEMISELATLTSKINKEVLIFEQNITNAKALGIDKAPGLAMQNDKTILRYYGFPSGYEFETFLIDLIDLSRGEIDIFQELAKEVKKINFPVHIQVFVTPQCPYCSSIAKVAHDFAMINPMIKGDVIDITVFQQLGEKYNIMSVPFTVINEKLILRGTYPPDVIIKKILELKH